MLLPLTGGSTSSSPADAVTFPAISNGVAVAGGRGRGGGRGGGKRSVPAPAPPPAYGMYAECSCREENVAPAPGERPPSAAYT